MLECYHEDDTGIHVLGAVNHMQIKHTTTGQYLQQKKAVQTCKLSKQKRIFHTMLVKNWLKQWLKSSKASKKKN